MTRLQSILAAGVALSFATAASAQTAAAPAAAQAAPATGAGVTTGATVYDPQGGTVGTIESVDAGFAVVSTGTNKVKLPLASFGAGANGPLISLTKAQLDAQVSQMAQSALQTALKVGAPVSDPQGGAVGTIESTDGQSAVIATGKVKAKVPVSSLAAGPNGLVIGLTAAQIAAQAASGGSGAATGNAAGSVSANGG